MYESLINTHRYALIPNNATTTTSQVNPMPDAARVSNFRQFLEDINRIMAKRGGDSPAAFLIFLSYSFSLSFGLLQQAT